MRALEVIVKPADISPLGQVVCCALHIELAGADDGLGCPHTMADVQCIGGGIAVPNRRLDEGSPASPAPSPCSSPPPCAMA
eukprot:3462933-Pyramimonas_sp.AAC.1